ncbi:putative hydrolase of the HAD superfamily/5'-nucleotidase [Kribbella amoyensis]|uniref:Putative hydrolase of the HAD superfamily/5'-nucleotidase n=1 Tax=Kribbella amoyensis TaxID=996641 RepID=A0A561BYX9_9ACTN|nr:HAD family hydrolase [Kribbella amoyensis]TWD84105.1 putative hydrolase of the HAD superfamily/5'-nucleotidase [Kribbella amoyensis]
MTAAAPRLACFDLDNTLIDRDAAFLAWARWWVDREGLDESAVGWLRDHDQGGFHDRRKLFAGLKEGYPVGATVPELVEAYDAEHPLFTRAEQAVLDGLESLRTAGWRVAVITNGGTVQQSLKLRTTGIDQVVDFACISEAAGVRKPDPRIFAVTAEQTGATLAGGWMVGDHPAYDIAGGINAGLSTIRIGHHHAVDTPVADHHFDSILKAFPVILAS